MFHLRLLQYIFFLLIVFGQLGIGKLVAQSPVEKEEAFDFNSIQSKKDIQALNTYVSELYQHHADSAIKLIQAAIPIAESLDAKVGLCDLHYYLGSAYAWIDQNSNALKPFQTTLTYAQELNDTRRHIRALQALGQCFETLKDRQRAINTLKQALKLNDEIKDREIEAGLLNRIGRYYAYEGRFDSAEYLQRQSLEVYAQLGDLHSQSGMYMNLGNNAARSGDIDKAISYYEEALHIKQEVEDKRGEALIFSMMGYSYLMMGQIPLSLDRYQHALEIYESSGEKDQLAGTLEAMAEVSLAVDDLHQAMIYLDRAQKLYDSRDWNQYVLNMKKANVFFLQENFDTTLQISLASIQFWKNTEVDDFPFESYLFAGLSYEKLGQPEEALPYLQAAFEAWKQDKNQVEMSNCLVNLGRVYLSLQDFQQAQSSLEEAISITQDIAHVEYQMEAMGLLYELYKAKGNETLALGYLETFNMLQDSLQGEERIKQMTRLEDQYVFEKEKQELEFTQTQELEKGRSRQRIILIALVAAALLIVVIAWFYRSQQRANKQLNHLNQELRDQKKVIEQQKEQLEELDEAKSRFFTNISHEFRTPLTIISGMAEQVNAKPDLWLGKGSQMIKQHAGHLLNLVNQILDLRKLESSKLELQMVQGDIVSYLRYIMDSFQAFAGSKGIQLHFLSEESELQMDYDPEKIMRIISNLLSNALKFTPVEGHIYIHLSQKNQLLHLQVRDTGEGIPATHLPYIFDRFYQVDDSSTRQGEGTGVGLALTKALVQLMKGEIEVSSEAGKGTSFLIKIPITHESHIQLTSQQAEIGEQVQAMAAEANESGLVSPVFSAHQTGDELPTILIVEDNPDVAQFLIACLEQDYQLQLANNGQEGIDKAIELIPDIILSDVMMPLKDGFELCATLKQDERTSHIPIILLTAKADLDSKVSGLELGADAYLPKPVEQKELFAHLRNVLKLRKQLQARYGSLDFVQTNVGAKPNKEDAFLIKVKELVEANLSDERFGNAQLAAEMNMSESQVYRKIKALTDKSPVPFIRSIRLHKAKKLLQSTDLNVSEVAYEVGFTDPAYFSRAFSKEFKITPKSIRK